MDLITSIMSRMADKVDYDTLKELEKVVSEETRRYKISIKVDEEEILESNEAVLEKFLAKKQVEGLSPRTIKIYRSVIGKCLVDLAKSFTEVSEQDVIDLFTRRKLSNASDSYLNTTRAYLTSFFSYCVNQGYTLQNPMSNISKIKTKKVIRPAFSEDDMYALRKAIKDKRELAILEFLYSSGVRASECVSLDITDLDFDNCTTKVIGKGNKERTVYFSNTARNLIREYLDERNDLNSALFVSKIKPYNRLQVSGLEVILKDLGTRAGIEDVHPHRFRRTLATNLLKKGMAIEEVKTILGHDKLDTTMIYCNINQDSVKYNYGKFMSA